MENKVQELGTEKEILNKSTEEMHSIVQKKEKVHPRSWDKRLMHVEPKYTGSCFETVTSDWVMVL